MVRCIPNIGVVNKYPPVPGIYLLRPQVVKGALSSKARVSNDKELYAQHKHAGNGFRRCALIFRFDSHAGRLICLLGCSGPSVFVRFAGWTARSVRHLMPWSLYNHLDLANSCVLPNKNSSHFIYASWSSGFSDACCSINQKVQHEECVLMNKKNTPTRSQLLSQGTRSEIAHALQKQYANLNVQVFFGSVAKDASPTVFTNILKGDSSTQVMADIVEGNVSYALCLHVISHLANK